ncbi:MAG: hypothetical protein E6I73_02625 [Chloroflexi bacterium]|nr:MAG: hypothetical protein E6I73_02625 [Chloroflexota bacterium]
MPFCGLNPQTLQGGIPNCTFTATSHGVVTVDKANVNPCSNVVGTATTVTNSIVHATVNGAGDVWVTNTVTAHFSFVPNAPGPPSYSGEMTFWFGASLNKNNLVFHDTGNIVLKGSDGSQLTLHILDHLNTSPSGAVNTFSIMSFTCP